MMPWRAPPMLLLPPLDIAAAMLFMSLLI